MLKKKIVIPILVTSLLASMIPINPVKATNESIVSNPSFEQAINETDMQLYKAERTKEQAYDGEYSIKVGMEKPANENDVPKWQLNLGKGSLFVTVKNIEPNTSYTMKMRVLNTTGVRMQAGVVDLEGKTSEAQNKWYPKANYTENAVQSEEWVEVTQTIKTSPRTSEFYIYAYCMNQKNGRDSGAFYVDDISVEKGETTAGEYTTSIDYTTPSNDEFPQTLPAIQSFNKTEGDNFVINKENQVFLTDEFSKEKTQYLADSMVSKGIIDAYTIENISEANDGEGIVLVKQPITFESELPDLAKYSMKDAYQMDITSNQIVIYSDYINGIQNGAMTLLQAATQRKELPAGTVKDYTDQQIRGFELDTARTFYSVDWLKEQMAMMAYYKHNTLHLRLKDSEGVRWDSKIVPALRDKEGYFYTKEDAKELVDYARSLNIEIIPEVDYPGHSEMEVQMLRNAGQYKYMIGGVFDITHSEIRQYMTSVIKEAAAYFDAKKVHIGGDEYFDIAGAAAKNKINAWAKEQTDNPKSNESDGMKLFFNEVAASLIDDGYEVLMWNDSASIGGTVTLDKRITVDIWAGGWRGSMKASDAIAEGYNVLSNSSTNYHNLWVRDNHKDSIRNPLPEVMYEQFTRYNYSKSSSTYSQDEKITANKERALGQMFPIWSDVLGGISGPVLNRTLFPRYATFAYVVWGAQMDNPENKPLNYAELERLMFALGAPREGIQENVKINYTKDDLLAVISKLTTGLNKKNNIYADKDIRALKSKLNTIKKTPANYAVKGFYTEIINEIIYEYENVEFVANHAAKKEALVEAVDDAWDVYYELDNYTAESGQVFLDAFSYAESLIEDVLVTQNIVDKAIEDLSDAIKALVMLDADYYAVDALIALAGKLNKDLYTDCTVLEDAIQSVIRDYDITRQKDVDKMARDISNALEEVNVQSNAKDAIDRSYLIFLLADYRQIKTTDYTAESVKVFIEQLEKGEDMLVNCTDQAEIDEFADEVLYYANQQLKYDKADYSAVYAAIEKAEKLNPENYIGFDLVFDAIWEVNYNLDVRKQAEVDEMAEKIETAIHNLIPKNLLDKESLRVTLADAKAYDVNLYTEATANTLGKAIVAAEALLTRDDITQEEINDAEATLTDAIAALTLKQADYSLVNQAVEKAKALHPEDYVDFSEVEKALDKVMEGLDITKQEQVNAMAEAIEKAIASLERKPVIPATIDKTKLNNLIKKAEKLVEKEYTADSWERFVNIFTQAKEILNTDELTQADVDAIVKALDKAIMGLKEKQDVAKPDKPLNPDKPITPDQNDGNNNHPDSNTPKTDKDKTGVKTGVNDLTGMNIMFLLIAGASIVVLGYTRKKHTFQ